MREFFTLLGIAFYSCFSFSVQAQTGGSFKIPDSLSSKSSRELKSIIYKLHRNDANRENYIRYYIEKAKEEKDTFELTIAYHFMASSKEEDREKHIYLDSLIAISKSRKDSIYPQIAHLYKGSMYHQKTDYKKAIDQYILAYTYASEKNQTNILDQITFNIGLLKSGIEEYRGALEDFMKYHKSITKNDTINNSYGHFASLYQISKAYRDLNLNDSATFYNRLGVLASSKTGGEWYHQFILNEGINEFHKKEYQAAIDSISKAIPFFSDPKRDFELMIIYSYLGKSNYELGFKEKAVGYLKESIDIFNKIRYVIPETRDDYNTIIDYYRSKKDYENHIKYVDYLSVFDSILKSDYKYLTKKIIAKYETAKLQQQKKLLLQKVENQERTNLLRNIVFSVLLLIALLIIFYFFNRQRIYKKRFEEFMKEQKSTAHKSAITEARQHMEVPKEIADNILTGLNSFEENLKYCDQHITLGSLAKKLNTNTKYLSMVINHIEGKSFRAYINDLRIQHTIDRLQTDRFFRKYAVKSIANEVGFNNPETFSKAFYRFTGLYPSFFIKQLEK